MCSIFGYIATGDARPSLKTLSAIVAANIRRGPHAFGFAWLDRRGRLRSYRQCGRLTDYRSLLRMVADARLLIGHLRWATQGEPDANINNHPHPCDGGWLVHNGIVSNYRDLAGDEGVYLSSECDSEAIGQLVETSAAPTLTARVKSAVRRTDGPLAILGLWHKPGTIVGARRGNPLHWSYGDEGLYLATLDEGLPGKVRAIPDNTLFRLARRVGRVAVKTTQLPSPRQKLAGLFAGRSGTYRGG